VTVKPHVRGRREIDGLELRRRRLVLVVLFRWFPVGDRVHHFEGGCCAEQSKKKFGEKMKQTLEKKKRDERA
jgi:KaiC/GvpD/RAD55 family RecA-like ATPase